MFRRVSTVLGVVDRLRQSRDRHPRIVLVSKDDCGLCDEALQALSREFGREHIDVVDILSDRDLEDRYVFRIPVAIVEGDIVAEGRIGQREARSIRSQLRSRRRTQHR